MYDEESNMPAMVRSPKLNVELGKVGIYFYIIIMQNLKIISCLYIIEYRLFGKWLSTFDVTTMG